MKIQFKILALAPLLIGSLIQGYALVRAKEDQVPEIPFVSAYVWQVDSPEQATEKQNEININRVYLPNAISNLMAKIGRGSKHAYHYDIFADNKGRNAEQNLDKTVYVYITKPQGAILGGPFKVAPHGVFAFILVKNPENSARAIEAKPTPQYSNEFVPAKDDTRNIKQLENEAKAKADKLLKGPLAGKRVPQTSAAQYPPAGPVKAPRYVRPVNVPRVPVRPAPRVPQAPIQAPAPAPAPQVLPASQSASQ